uniref:Uncharacterized protein n=1 Tax=Anguilla anguilla TaxID=7936 RepID=A0A0E9V967_ANGAN
MRVDVKIVGLVTQCEIRVEFRVMD